MSLAVEREREIVLPRAVERGVDVVGVDLGLRAAAVIHDGASARAVPPPRALRNARKRLRRLDRRLARKQRGSRNRAKAKLKRARLHYKISCQRSDFLHKLSSELAKTKPVIVLEDLQVSHMQHNRRLALSASDAALGTLRRQLEYKSDWYGSRLLVADRFYASTQICSGCGRLNHEVRGFAGLKERWFDCSTCGISLDRDENAALNLRSVGLKWLATELEIDLLPEGLREVTPDGEEGSGLARVAPNETASLKQEAKARRASGETRRSTRKRVEV